ncbi:unnamed protein product [Paramecium sonneborni]|uniref:Uncharacterized protein n=1 Tax=Paramecium sonneborni TaxID=65129 RepID=A0A8S1NQT4_9CILI|nr:unnamed protein product [Paramecium sonneborni]
MIKNKKIEIKLNQEIQILFILKQFIEQQRFNKIDNFTFLQMKI